MDEAIITRAPGSLEQALGTRVGIGRTAAAVTCVGVAALVPLVTGNLYFISVATLICVYAALAQCWNLVMGVAGIWSFAQVTLFAVGAYANVLLMVKVGAPGGLAFIGGGVAALVAGLLIGIPSVRLRGVYVVLFTLAFQEIMRILIATDDSGFTGGTFGIYGFDAFDLTGFSPHDKAKIFYYTGLALLCVVAYAIFRVMQSPVGLAFRSLRDAEPYATARGVDRRKFQIFVFAFTAFLTGLVGAFYADYLGTVTPSILSFELISLLLAMIVIGGWGTFTGPILGAIVIVVISEKLRDANEWRLLTLGLVMMVIIIYIPRGLVGLAAHGRVIHLRGREWLDRWLEGG